MLLPTRPLRVAAGPSCILLLPAFIGKERCCGAWTRLTRSIELIDRSRYRHVETVLGKTHCFHKACCDTHTSIGHPKQDAERVVCCEALSSLLRSPSRQTRHHHMHASPTSCNHQRKPRRAELYTRDNKKKLKHHSFKNINTLFTKVFHETLSCLAQLKH